MPPLASDFPGASLVCVGARLALLRAEPSGQVAQRLGTARHATSKPLGRAYRARMARDLGGRAVDAARVRTASSDFVRGPVMLATSKARGARTWLEGEGR